MRKRPILWLFVLLGFLATNAGSYHYGKVIERAVDVKLVGELDRKLHPQTTPTPVSTLRDPLNRDNVLILVNEARLKAGRQQLPTRQDLTSLAQKRAEQIDASRDCSHEPDTTELAGKSELISCDTSNSRITVNTFLSSPTHADIMLNQLDSAIGIGVSGKYVVILITR